MNGLRCDPPTARCDERAGRIRMRVVTLALAVAATLQVAACGTAPPPLMRSPTVFRSTSAGRVPARLSLRGGGALEISTTCDQTNMGECVGIVGDGHALGNWKNPRRMDGKGFPKWKVTVDVNEGDKLEYKYCIVGSDGGIARWETKGSSVNRKCKVTGEMLQSGLKDKPYGCGGGMGGSKHVSSGGRGERPGGHVDWKMDFKDLDDFGKALCQANRDNGSWRQKLEYVKNLFHDEKLAATAGFNAASPATSHLAVIAIYLTFLSTGQVPCFDVGGHNRPCHHAMLARSFSHFIFLWLSLGICPRHHRLHVWRTGGTTVRITMP